MGKLHGVATLTLNAKSNKTYRGEWEDGKRLRWLDSNPSIINSGISMRDEK